MEKYLPISPLSKTKTMCVKSGPIQKKIEGERLFTYDACTTTFLLGCIQKNKKKNSLQPWASFLATTPPTYQLKNAEVTHERSNPELQS